MRVRRLLRKALKPLAMVGIVGALSLSLVVTTPSNAQAFSNGDELLKAAPRIAGAVKTAAPGVIAVATSVTPTGWAIKAVWLLATLALETSDTWVPFVTGLFGQSTTAPPAGGTYMKIVPGLKFGAAPTFSAATGYERVSGNLVYSGNTTGSYAVLGAARCQRKDGSLYTRVANSNGGFGPGDTPPYAISCSGATGDKLLTAMFGAPCSFTFPDMSPCTSATTVPGPEGVISYGQAINGSNGFDPRGSSVGYQGESECIAPDGTVSWISAETYTGSAGAVKMPSCAAAGKGHGTGATRVTAFKPDGTKETVWEMPRPASDPSTPLCDVTLPSSGCTLEVLKDDQPCVVGDVECENWASEKSKDPTRWKCKFGPYTLPLSACNLLEQAYRIGGALATEKNTDGDPSTQDNNDYSGKPVPQPGPGPIMNAPGTGTGTAPVPGGAGQPSPSADSSAKACWPTGWAALNPFEWVMKPVGCALEAAFKPTKDLQSRVTGMKEKFSNKVPVSWFGVGVEGASGGGCPADWAVEYDGHRYSLICGTDADSIIRGFRPVLGGMLIMAMLWPFLRSLFYAAIPVFKVTPS